MKNKLKLTIPIVLSLVLAGVYFSLLFECVGEPREINTDIFTI